MKWPSTYCSIWSLQRWGDTKILWISVFVQSCSLVDACLETAGEQNAHTLFLRERKANISHYQRTALLIISQDLESTRSCLQTLTLQTCFCQVHFIYELWRMECLHSLTSVCPIRKLLLRYSWTSSICPENMLCPCFLLNLYTKCHCERKIFWSSKQRLQKLECLWKFNPVVNLRDRVLWARDEVNGNKTLGSFSCLFMSLHKSCWFPLLSACHFLGRLIINIKIWDHQAH